MRQKMKLLQELISATQYVSYKNVSGVLNALEMKVHGSYTSVTYLQEMGFISFKNSQLSPKK